MSIQSGLRDLSGSGGLRGLAGTPALVVFVLPGVLAVMQGRKAIRLGRPDGRVPAIVGAAVGAAFVGLNVVSYVLQV